MADLFHHLLRWIHIIVGTIGLILFWIPVFSRKGGKLHRATGVWYVRCVVVVTISALISCAWAWIDPISFLSYADTIPTTQGIQQMRFFFGLLALVATMALTGALFGSRILKVKDRDIPIATPSLSAALGLEFLISISILLWCFSLLLIGKFQGMHSAVLAISILTFLDSRSIWNHLRKPGRIPWLHLHLEAMLACGIAFHTAALVTIFARVVPFQLPPPWFLLPWLLPTIIGVPAIYWLKSRLSKKDPTP